MTAIELTIEKVVTGGQGIGRSDGVVVFVPLSAPGDRLKVAIEARKRNYWQGRIEEIIEPSPLRTEPLCPHYGVCGGCDLQHLSYEAQLVTKKLIVNDALQRIGKIFVPPGNPLSSGEQWHYRNKSQYPVQDAPWRVGFFERKSHRVVDVKSCPIQPEGFDRLVALLRERLETSGETAYLESDASGNLRHIVIQRGSASHEIALTFVTATSALAAATHKGLMQECPELVSVTQNVNPKVTNRILGERFDLLAGRPYYTEQLLDKKLQISAGSFFQANTAATELLVKRILKYIEPDGDQTVLDLYCGVGTISLPISGFVGKVIGIELNPNAAADARANVAANDARNVQIIEAAVENGIASVERADVVILDPPRKGCAPEVLKRVTEFRPRAIIHVSCNPATLARDLALLAELGYEAAEVQPVDMFPQTAHVECVAKVVPVRG
jgi:23S rRNA (uracil1939-C5)-methyltransferase